MNDIKSYESFQNQNILIVEDDPDILELMNEIFEEYFSQVFLATNGLEALAIFKNEVIDVIVCDIKMPKMDGIETVKRIREINYSIPIIFLSALTDNDLLLKASNLNIQGYVLKPVSIDEILKILEKLKKYQYKSEIVIDFVKLDEDILLDCNNYQLLMNKQIVLLTPKEFNFLKLLLEKRGTVVPYHLIEQVIWYENNEVMSSTSLRTLVKNIRKKLVKENIVQNISKVGYKIV